MYRFFVATLIFCVSTFCTSAQQYRDTAVWNKIENAILTRSYLQQAANDVRDLKPNIWKARDYPAYARFCYYGMMIDDLRTEDTLYFQNSAFIDALLEDPGNPDSFKALLHLMQAKRLFLFAHKEHAFNRKLYERKGLRHNYAAFTNPELDSIVRTHFSKANKYVLKVNYPTEDILWLSYDPSLYQFRPTFADMIIGEQMHLEGTAFTLPFDKEEVEKWMALSPDSLMMVIDTLQPSTKYLQLKLFAEWGKLHEGDKPKYYLIEQTARKFIAKNLSYSSTSSETAGINYEKYLQQSAVSPYDQVKANSIAELAEFWRLKGDLYNSVYGTNWDSSYQYYPAKAIRLYEDNKELLANYPQQRSYILNSRAMILRKQLSGYVNDINPVNAPIPVTLHYKNVSRIWYKIIQVEDTFYEDKKISHEENLKKLFIRTVYRKEELQLPLPEDYNSHAATLKIDPLPAGDYYLVYADHPIETWDDSIAYQRFKVSSIALLEDDGQMYILDRRTGFPMVNAVVKNHNRTVHVNDQGAFEVQPGDTSRLTITTGNEVLHQIIKATNREDVPDGFDDDYDDSVEEYFNDHIKVNLFTDRSIYRPGQTIYFKGIFFTTDKSTGFIMLANAANMKKYFRKWCRLSKPLCYLKTPFGMVIDSLAVLPDEYGAVSGSFVIPRLSAVGEWEIVVRDSEDEWEEDKGFRVEEYKRPTYELLVEKGAPAFSMDDTLSWKVRAKSFAGAVLTGLPVHYKISGDHVTLEGIKETNSKGELELRLYDTTLDRRYDSLEAHVQDYQLKVWATDATGETHEAEDRVTINSRPVYIKAVLPENFKVDEWKPLLIQAMNYGMRQLNTVLTVKLYRLEDSLAGRKYATDQFIYPRGQLDIWFPGISSPEKKEHKQLVYETVIHTGDAEKLRLPEALLVPGNFALSVECIENGQKKGEFYKRFQMFDTKGQTSPGEQFFYLPLQSISKGDTLKLYRGSNLDSTFLLQQIKYCTIEKGKLKVNIINSASYNKAGISLWNWVVPDNITGYVLVTNTFIKNNEIYRKSERVKISEWDESPQIIIEQYRKQLTPGAKTTFSVAVKTKNVNTAAELMSVMYDASLDRIEKHSWSYRYESSIVSLYNRWQTELTQTNYSRQQFPSVASYPVTDNPLWALNGMVPGIAVLRKELNETVVIAYGTTTRMLRTGNYSYVFHNGPGRITIRGMNSLAGSDKPIYVLDGVLLEGKIEDINLNEITGIDILRDADATAIYGSRGANGVVLLSTKGAVVLPKVKVPEVPVKVRSNFNETAFFFPSVRASKDGYYYFPFTIPESTTEWNWKLLAHTKQGKFAYEERKLVTQLPLMIHPNMPRLLYQGDRMTLQTRISNLDTVKLKGTIFCEVEDEVTGEVLNRSSDSFNVDASSNTAVAFNLSVPATLLHPVKITIKAQAGAYADGEEHIIPVFAKKALIKEIVPFHIYQDTTLNLPVAGGVLAGAGLSIDPLPHAAIINSLPYLAHYSYNCAEQTFNKLFAYAIGLKLMRENKDMQLLLENVRSKTAQDTIRQLPASPWMDLANKTKQQHRDLYGVLDTAVAKQAMDKHLERLQDLQKSSGGLSWFDKGNEDPYISMYVLAGFGEMEKDGISVPRNNNFISSLVRYCDANFNDNEEDYIIARSYWKDKYPLKHQDSIQSHLTRAWNMAGSRSLAGKVKLIKASLLSEIPAFKQLAMSELASIKEAAIVDEQGVRWKDISSADDMTIAAEEILAMLADVYSYDKDFRAGILKWLLNSQFEHHWSTTKGTAAAIKLLMSEKTDLQAASQKVEVTLGNTHLNVFNTLLDSKYFDFAPAAHIPEKVQLKTKGEVKGSVITYYFRDWQEVKSGDIQISKQYKYSGLKKGDKVTVVLTINNSKSLRYVHINDKRAAAFEPVDGSSDYVYGNEFRYYRSVRDEGMDWFADFIPAGEHVIEYELLVMHEGEFSCGPASIECMYRPEIQASSEAVNIKTN